MRASTKNACVNTVALNAVISCIDTGKKYPELGKPCQLVRVSSVTARVHMTTILNHFKPETDKCACAG